MKKLYYQTEKELLSELDYARQIAEQDMNIVIDEESNFLKDDFNTNY